MADKGDSRGSIKGPRTAGIGAERKLGSDIACFRFAPKEDTLLARPNSPSTLAYRPFRGRDFDAAEGLNGRRPRRGTLLVACQHTSAPKEAISVTCEMPR
jgi:hypothetical protein